VFGVDDGAYILGGVTLTQLVVVFGIVYGARQSRTARRVAESTNEAVNNVDKENGEPTLINQVREHGRILRRHSAHHEWSATVLQEVARQAGVNVPPLPEDDEEAA
jgi:hypothetical protein